MLIILPAVLIFAFYAQIMLKIIYVSVLTHVLLTLLVRLMAEHKL